LCMLFFSYIVTTKVIFLLEYFTPVRLLYLSSLSDLSLLRLVHVTSVLCVKVLVIFLTNTVVEFI